jgi:hypothetical protein
MHGGHDKELALLSHLENEEVITNRERRGFEPFEDAHE